MSPWRALVGGCTISEPDNPNNKSMLIAASVRERSPEGRYLQNATTFLSRQCFLRKVVFNWTVCQGFIGNCVSDRYMQDYFTNKVYYSVEKSGSPRDVTQEILYGPHNRFLRLDILPLFTAISMHLGAFDKTIRTKFAYEALFAYVSCICYS